MIAPALLFPLLVLLLGPERELAPPLLGVPPTDDRVLSLAASDRSFLIGFRAGLVSSAVSTGRDAGAPADEIVPSPAGTAMSIASDGERFLALYRGHTDWDLDTGVPTYRAHIGLLDERGIEVRRSLDIEGAAEGSRRSIVWTGEDYLVAWVGVGGIIRGARIGRDGTAIGEEFLIAEDSRSLPFLASAGGEVLVALLKERFCQPGHSCLELHLLAVDRDNDVTRRQVMLPGSPSILDFTTSAGSLFLLLHESNETAQAQNLYRLTLEGAPTRVSHLLPLGSPGLVDHPEGVVAYGSVNERIVVQRFSDLGLAVSSQFPILESRVRDIPLGVIAARSDDTITFAWSEVIAGPPGAFDPVFATIDIGFAGQRGLDGQPDGVLLARGAAMRRAPAAASGGGSTLTVWREQIDGWAWIGGSLVSGEGAALQLEISPRIADEYVSMGAPKIASTGRGFLVVWTVPGVSESAVRARHVGVDGSLGEVIEITDREATRIDVAAHAGGYVVVWEDPDRTILLNDRNGHTIHGQRFDDKGQPVDSEPRLLAGPSASEPALASNGERLLLVWTDGSICTRALCAFDTPLNLKGRVFNSALDPASSEFTLADDPRANETEVAVTGSTNQWLVAWTARRREFRSFANGSYALIEYSDIGHALVSNAGSTSDRFSPPIDEPRYRRTPAVWWSGSNYVLAFADEGIHLRRIAPNGVALDESAEPFPGSEPALTNGMIVYSRPAPERLIGAAPQVFSREIADDPIVRRRAVDR